MNKELLQIAEQLEVTFRGDPWFGKSITSLLNDIDETFVFERPNSQHSILELIWHMITWRGFVLNSFHPSPKASSYFEDRDWQQLDHSDKTLWKSGLEKLHQTQQQLLHALTQQDDSILENKVTGRSYNYRKLLNGILQHDIYHLGQIAYISKLLRNK